MNESNNKYEISVASANEFLSRFGIVDILKPVAPHAALLRAAGIRMIVTPETYEALKTMGPNGELIAANIWIVDRKTDRVYTVSQWQYRMELIAAGKINSLGQKPGFFITLANILGFTNRKKFEKC